MNTELESAILEIDLEVNNIFLLNTLKKLRAFYFEESYKERTLVESLVSKSETNKESLSEVESEKVKSFLENEEKFFSSLEIFISDKKILSLVKISPQQFELIRPTLDLFLIKTNEKQAINILSTKFYFDNTDTKLIEDTYLTSSLAIEKSKDIISLENMTFNDKVQKIYSTIETLTNQKTILKQMETETLESDASWVELQAQKEEIAEAMKQRKLEILSNTSLQTKNDEINKELTEEKKVLVEFLEFSIENGEYKDVSVRNKEGKEMKPQISISLKEVKNK